MSTLPAIAVACEASEWDRVAVVTGEHAATYESARAWVRSWGWTSPFDSDWCPNHAGQYGGAGYPQPFDHLQATPTASD